MKIATDIGGTFTDLAYIDEAGQIQYAKSATTPPNFEQGVMNVLRENDLSQAEVETFIHGTTVIINALTQRQGAKTGLLTTKGFRDVLEIARGNRPDLFNVQYQKPTPFIERYLRLEVEERMNYQGEVVQPLKRADVEEAVTYFKEEGVESIAVVYLHAYVNDTHEQETVQIIEELWPEVHVSASSDITKEWREYERTNTTALNAFVKPIASAYVNQLEKELDNNLTIHQKYIMQSNGGTTSFANAKSVPVNMVESGPVAGIYGAATLGKLIGEENIIAFDIGGTTAKCSLIESGEVKTSTDYYIERDDRHAGYPIKVPVVDIVEIGNGGGSIAWLDKAGTLKVGPQSAGADPGPVAYNQGGTEPTTTDANILTGRLATRHFNYDVDLAKVRQALDTQIAQPMGVSTDDAALGIIRIANSNMLNALKLVSVRKGYDPTDFTLLAFGGGGSMHAPALALELGVKRVVIPIASPVFSAWGMLMTDLRHDYIQTHIATFDTIDIAEVNQEWQRLEVNCRADFEAENFSLDKVSFHHAFDMRYAGQEHTVKVSLPDGELTQADITDIIQTFHAAHEKAYNFTLPGNPIEIVNYHLTGYGQVDKPEIAEIEVNSTLEDAFVEERSVLFEQKGWLQTKVYDRELLPVGDKLQGPVIVEEAAATTVVYPEQVVYRDKYGNLIIEKEA
ncbi:5-oxoprolinase [Suicoccus acidiformans]|uniref:5-oxoprolinase n=1 Tax=Suicoccus acidiformans TaxID=2036206 RepID=A0A347WKS7_9LACT|nr:hydantoinase/oxoprolinase family protein [Suicoccus acidiformans]AXY25684.1 5-oxoprolinase [Suicoccus acidiformans]